MLAALSLLAGLLAWPGPARAADPERGALLFAAPPAPGLLGCADCHSDNPVVNNFGNIWAGRNAVALIERAIQSNTGGMGYLRNYRSAADLADIAAYLGNSPAALTFPPTAVGARSSVRTVTVASSTKAGAGAFEARVEGDFQMVASDCSAERPRFSTCSIELAFTPSAAGERRGTLVMTHDATPTPVRLALSGTVPDRPPAVARVTPQALDFGSSPRGLPSLVRTATLSNDSSEALTLSALAVDGGFAIVGGQCTAGTVLARGERCSVAVRFEAAASGPAAGRLMLDHDGTGGRSVVALTALSTPAAAARLQADVDGLDFGALASGSSATRSAVRLHNTGTGDWPTIVVDTLGSGFDTDTSACTAALPLRPGQGCTLLIGFTPPRSGRFSGTLRLDGAGLEAALELPLQGRGLPLAAPAARLQVDPARLLFDAVVGRSASLQLRLSHTGPAALPLAAWRLDGPAAADFAVEPAGTTCGSVLAAGAACTISLRFTPGVAGLRSARLRMAADAGSAGDPAAPENARDNALDIPLAGRATATPEPRLAVDAVALRFGSGLAGAQRFRVVNAGTVDWLWARRLATGDHAADFRLAGSCFDAARLPAGARCDIDVGFAPSAAGPRVATLLLQPVGGAAVSATMSGQGAFEAPPRAAAPSAALLALPEQVVFQARTAQPGSTQRQTVRWRNDGNTVLRIADFELQAAGFALDAPTSPGTDRCPPPPFALLPGQTCSVVLSWPGSSAGAEGARLVAVADDPWGGAAVDISVSEDPAQRSNVGSGGGAPGALGWWLGLVLAVAVLTAPRRRPMPRNA